MLDSEIRRADTLYLQVRMRSLGTQPWPHMPRTTPVNVNLRIRESTTRRHAEGRRTLCSSLPILPVSGGPYGENLASSYGYSDPIGTGLTGWENEACQSPLLHGRQRGD
jgi:hypothetical protein